MPEDPTSWYCWWSRKGLKDLQLRNIYAFVVPGKRNPNWKKRLFWVGIAEAAFLGVLFYIFRYLYQVSNR